MLIQAFGRVTVGQHLVVRDQHEDLRAEIGQPDPVEQGAEVVAEVQQPGRPVPGQDPEHPGVGVDLLLELGRTPLCKADTHRSPLKVRGRPERTKKAVHPDGLWL